MRNPGGMKEVGSLVLELAGFSRAEAPPDKKGLSGA
jgi:hypothetical protein